MQPDSGSRLTAPWNLKSQKGSMSKKKSYRTDEVGPSNMFINSLAGYGCGSPDLECGWCGRIHLCPESRSYKDDEDSGAGWKEDCESQYKDNPAGVILHYDWDAVSGQELNGIMFVIDCPCNGLYRYEQFIWAEKDTIRNYLKKRIDYEFELTH